MPLDDPPCLVILSKVPLAWKDKRTNLAPWRRCARNQASQLLKKWEGEREGGRERGKEGGGEKSNQGSV